VGQISEFMPAATVSRCSLLTVVDHAIAERRFQIVPLELFDIKATNLIKRFAIFP
jgi:hypothetical protein